MVVPENVGPESPPGSERLSLRVRQVQVEGTFPELAAETAAIVTRLSGKTVTAAEIFAAARELEQAYFRAGFALARVVLPAQRLTTGGDVRLLVVDGYIERIDTSALPPAVRGRIAAVLEPLVGTRRLPLSLLERALLLAGDTPGTVLRSALAAGSAPGASLLVVEARYKPVTGQLTADNTLSAALGRYNFGAGFDLNSVLGFGELIYLRVGGAPYTPDRASFVSDDPRNRVLAAGVVAPLGDDGLTLNLEGTNARTTPRAAPGALEFTSEFQRFSTRLRYPLIRSRDLTVNLGADFDVQDEQLRAIRPIAAPLSLDRLRIARTGGDLLWITPTDATFTARLFGSFGIDALGARPPPPIGSPAEPLSRVSARPEFQKAELALTLVQPLAEHLTLDLRARGQLAFNQALPRSEQIGLATPTGLSSFDAGLFQGDDGFVVRGELQAPFVLPFTVPFVLPSIPEQQGRGLPEGETTSGAMLVSPYAFGAFGEVHLQRPTALERAWIRGSAYGVGIRLGAAPQASFTNASVTVEYGRQERSDRVPTSDRITFAAILQF